MNILIVYWHPEPQSFNAALFELAQSQLEADGHKVRTSDLYKMDFNPVSGRHNFRSVANSDFFKQQAEEVYATEQNTFADDIEGEIRKVEWADLVIFQFPLWWFSMPAVMKGWVDRVFVMGRSYGGGRYYETGFFQGKKAMLCITTGGPESIYTADGMHGEMDSVLKPMLRGILAFTGFDVLAPQITYSPAHLSDQERAEVLQRFKSRLIGVAEEPCIQVEKF